MEWFLRRGWCRLKVNKTAVLDSKDRWTCHTLPFWAFQGRCTHSSHINYWVSHFPWFCRQIQNHISEPFRTHLSKCFPVWDLYRWVLYRGYWQFRRQFVSKWSIFKSESFWSILPFFCCFWWDWKDLRRGRSLVWNKRFWHLRIGSRALSCIWRSTKGFRTRFLSSTDFLSLGIQLYLSFSCRKDGDRTSFQRGRSGSKNPIRSYPGRRSTWGLSSRIGCLSSSLGCDWLSPKKRVISLIFWALRVHQDLFGPNCKKVLLLCSGGGPNSNFWGWWWWEMQWWGLQIWEFAGWVLEGY